MASDANINRITDTQMKSQKQRNRLLDSEQASHRQRQTAREIHRATKKKKAQKEETKTILDYKHEKTLLAPYPHGEK